MPRPTCLRPSWLALVLSIVGAAAWVPGTALASRTPTDSELGAISSAALADCSLHQSDCVVSGAIVSDVDDEYAWVSAKGAKSDYDALLSSSGSGTDDWTVIIVQTQDAPRNCSDYAAYDVPPAVLDDLEVRGMKAGSASPVTCGTPAVRPKTCSSATVKGIQLGVSVLSLSCSKARSVAISTQKHAGKAPSGWAVVRPDACTAYLVPRKYRAATHPLIDVPRGKAVIFVDDLTTPACTGDDSASGTTSGTATASTTASLSVSA